MAGMNRRAPNWLHTAGTGTLQWFRVRVKRTAEFFSLLRYLLFANVVYFFRLQLLLKKRRELLKGYDLKLSELGRTPDTREAYDALISEAAFESDFADEDVNELLTEHLREEADRLLVEMPSYRDDTMWTISNVTERRFLSPKGLEDIRSRIRAERKLGAEARTAVAGSFVSVIGSLTGIAGVAVAALAIWYKK